MILCHNLVKIYKTAHLETVALQGLDLAVAEGEMLGIVGASGSGKTTLLNILGGLDRPSAGRVTVGGRDLLKLSDRELDRYRRTQVGFVWQQTSRNLIPYLTARENVELPMTIAGVGLREKRRRSRELLEAVGLWAQRKHRLAQLSGGQQQRVAIAVALANRPRLLLADEPTGEVDSATARQLFDLFRQMNQRYGLTLLIVSHDPQIARWMDRVVAIRDGKIGVETVRKEGGETEEPAHTEYIVLDSVGRLQLPAEYRARYGIGDRVTLEAVEGGVLIRPVEGRERAVALPVGKAPDPPLRKSKHWRHWFGRKK